MEPRIRYALTSDGRLIAYATSGEGPVLVSIPGPPDNHLELEWEDPERRASVEAIAQHRTLVRFDPRGSGLSDRDPGTYSLDERLSDLEAVVAEAAPGEFDLITGAHGAQLAVAYAARNPDRVRTMVLIGPVTRGSDFLPAGQRAMMEQVLRGDYATFTQMVGAMTFGWGREEGPRYSAFFQAAVSQPAAVAIYGAMMDLDVTHLAREVRCPVLVIDQESRAATGAARRLASLIPRARYQPAPGMPVEGVTRTVLRLIGEFFGEDWHTGAMPDPQSAGRVTLGVILFTDIEDHTMLVDRLGDVRARSLLREYEAATRRAIREQGGTEVKAMGDGFMAWFPSASGALDCAIRIQEGFSDLHARHGEPVRVRVGLNAGEPVVEANDLFGTAVIVAARAAASARGGEVVVTDVVRQLVAGKGYLFSDRGTTLLKGFEDPVRTWLLRS